MVSLHAKTRVRGVALVEFAIVLPLLLFFLLGIIEFGMMVLHKLTLEEAAREGVRVAAVRRPIGEIAQRITNSAAALPDGGEMQITLSYSIDNGQTFPYTLANTGEENNAPPGSLIQARIDWPHHLTTGSFFARLLGADDNIVPMGAQVVMRRE